MSSSSAAPRSLHRRSAVSIPKSSSSTYYYYYYNNNNNNNNNILRSTAITTAITAAAADDDVMRQRKKHHRRRQLSAIHNTSTTTTATASVDDSFDDEDSDSNQAQTKLISATRNLVVTLCFVAFMLCNMDRVNMSVAIMPMSATYGWDGVTQGIIQSSFFWGYLCTQVLGGVLADRYGGKYVLGLGVVWWSLATALTPFAAGMGISVLAFVRVMMGIGEGVAMPAMNAVVAKWVPRKFRSRSLGLVYSGMYIGSVLGLVISPYMLNKYGVSSIFVPFGVLGFVWFFLWNRFVSSAPPRRKTTLNKPEKESEPTPWGILLRNKAVWAIVVAHFCHNWGLFIMLTWMPSYFNSALGYNLVECGWMSAIPWLVMAICANAGGYVADNLINLHGWSTRDVRRLMQGIGFLGPATFLTLMCATGSSWPQLAVTCMCLAQGLGALSQSGLYSNHQDLASENAGALLGLSNSAGVLAGSISTYVAGLVLAKTGGVWTAVWMSAVVFQLVGAVWYTSNCSGDRIAELPPLEEGSPSTQGGRK